MQRTSRAPELSAMRSLLSCWINWTWLLSAPVRATRSTRQRFNFD